MMCSQFIAKHAYVGIVKHVVMKEILWHTDIAISILSDKSICVQIATYILISSYVAI